MLGNCNHVINTPNIISSITRVKTLPPKKEINCFKKSTTVFVGEENTQILFVRNANRTTIIQEITFAINSFIPNVTFKNAYETILRTNAKPPKKR